MIAANITLIFSRSILPPGQSSINPFQYHDQEDDDEQDIDDDDDGQDHDDDGE